MMRTTMVVMMTTIMTKFKLPRKPAAGAVISCSPFKAAKAGRPTVFHLLSSSCDKDYPHHHHPWDYTNDEDKECKDEDSAHKKIQIMCVHSHWPLANYTEKFIEPTDRNCAKD